MMLFVSAFVLVVDTAEGKVLQNPINPMQV